MKKLLLAGMVMVLAAGVFAEIFTVTGVVAEKKWTHKKTGKELKKYTLSTDEYKNVEFAGGKAIAIVKDLVGQTITLEVDAEVKKTGGLKVKKIVAVK